MVTPLSLVGGSIWGAGFLLSHFGATDVYNSLWAIIICLMVGSAMILSAIPLSSILFITVQRIAMSSAGSIWAV